MLLRTRITLMVSFCTVAMAVVLLGDGHVRERRATERYESTLVAGDRNAWFGVEASASERLNAYAADILHDDRVTRAVADRDRAELTQGVADTAHRALAAKIPIQTEIFSADGQVQFATTSMQAPLTPKGVVVAVVQRGAAVRGLARTPDNGLVQVLASPFYSRSGVSGVLVVFSDVAALLDDVAAVTKASTYLLGDEASSGDAAAKARNPAGWVAARLPAGQDEGVLNRGLDRHVFQADWFTVRDALDRPAGRMIAVRDITEGYRRAELISLLSRGALASGGVLFFAFLYWYLRNAFRPLNAVIRVLNALSRGDTAAPKVEAEGRHDEIGRLAGTLENFRQAQKARDQLARIRQDIDAASRIQHSILPRDFPVTDRYRLHAIMRPAQNVGGDFYDFFDLPGGRIGIVIADVSGKGMGAAMFMVLARTVIRSVALVTDDPGECLARANDLLCANNSDGSTFVTVFYGILDPATGRVAYANGGHNPPYRLRPGAGASAVPGTGGLALGVMEGTAYADGEIGLAPGDLLFLYTDGVSEAMSPEGEQFTEERLEAALGGMDAADVTSAIETVVRAVDAFADEAPQADDITCLTVAFGPFRR